MLGDESGGAAAGGGDEEGRRRCARAARGDDLDSEAASSAVEKSRRPIDGVHRRGEARRHLLAASAVRRTAWCAGSPSADDGPSKHEEPQRLDGAQDA